MQENSVWQEEMVLKQSCPFSVSVSCLAFTVVWLFNVNTYATLLESLSSGKEIHNQ